MTDWYKQQQDKIREQQRQADQNKRDGLFGRTSSTNIYSPEYKQGLLEREQRNLPWFSKIK